MDREAQLRNEAWIGDAVLGLYARLRILSESGRIDADCCMRMTSNQFLSAFGTPTAVEAGVGRLYNKSGLEAAFAFIEAALIPTFEKQELKRQRLRSTKGMAHTSSVSEEPAAPTSL